MRQTANRDGARLGHVQAGSSDADRGVTVPPASRADRDDATEALAADRRDAARWKRTLTSKNLSTADPGSERQKCRSVIRGTAETPRKWPRFRLHRGERIPRHARVLAINRR